MSSASGRTVIDSAVLDALVRLRWRIATVVVLAEAVLSSALSSLPADIGAFHRYGDLLLHGHLGQVYDDPWNQSGPFEAIVSYVLVPKGQVQSPALGVYVAFNVIFLFMMRLVALSLRRESGRPHSPGVEAAVAASVVLYLLPNQLWDTHPAEWAIALCWLGAALLVARQRAVIAGGFIAFAAGFEVWGLLAVPLLLVVRSKRTQSAGIAVAVAGTALAYLPFVLSANFRFFEKHWEISSASIYGLFGMHGTFPWSLRVVQAVACLAAAALVARRLQGSTDALWLVPLTASLVRILMDPRTFGYYWITPAVLATCGLATLGDSSARRRNLTLLCLAYVPFVASAGLSPLLASGLALALVAVVATSRP